jgi:transcriptional regulator with XRE-family HTH domain
MAGLREWRERLGLSRERVAARMTFSTRTLERWELQDRDPGEVKRRQLANLYTAAEENPEEWIA